MEKNHETRKWHFRQTEVAIYVNQLKKNYYKIKETVGKAKILALMKSNAYGHGLQIAKYLDDFSMQDALEGFAVANVEEGIELREFGVKSRIYILSGIQSISDELIDCIREYRLVPVISSITVLKSFLKNSKTRGIAYHLKINTGMNRLGIALNEVEESIHLIKQSSNNLLEGIMSHYACAENPKSKFTLEQTKKFRQVLQVYKKNNLAPKFVHMENSAGSLNHCLPESNLVRVGLHLYGINSEIVKPIMQWTAQIYDIRTVSAGEGIGYGPIYRTKKKSKIAILGAGYGDGYPRSLSNKADVLIHGKRCKVVGAVSMDMIAVDVSKVPQVSKNSRAILIGEDRNDCITAVELSNKAKCIPWEIITGISARVPRVYIS